MVKDEATMVAAYNDARGLSAEFNLNILNVVNRELGGDIPLDAFSHETRFDADASCMVQSLRATRKVVANLRALDLAVTFLAGEEIHTEVSCKFTRAEVEDNFSAAGISLDDWLTDPHKQFAIALGSRR